jgi:hypothetical protein
MDITPAQAATAEFLCKQASRLILGFNAKTPLFSRRGRKIADIQGGVAEQYCFDSIVIMLMYCKVI